MTNEMVLYEPSGDIQVYRKPADVIADATAAATALVAVLALKKKPFIINGEQYLEFEDWQTVGRFYGVTAKVKETRFIEFGGVKGFEAKAVAIRSDGMEITAAEAMCLDDEEKWSKRPKYEYLYICKDGTKVKEDPGKDFIIWIANPKNPGKRMPKKVREQVGMEPVPLFQLRSMAQTRACAKALRNVLAWVVVLAGYKPTPAEELDGQSRDEEDTPDSKSAPEPGSIGEVLSKGELKGNGAPVSQDKRVQEAIDLLNKEGGYAGAVTKVRMATKSNKNPDAWTQDDLKLLAEAGILPEDFGKEKGEPETHD